MSQKRNLPSWMSSRDPESSKKKPKDDDEVVYKQEISTPNNNNTINPPDFSKLLEGVVFVLSGFVNPERSTLRSQALAMGATYQPDWNSDSSTLLISAFPNTPKFRQVQSNSGTIVSKDWISECYMQKKLIDIEQYLMHAGKPWRKTSVVPKDTTIREKKKQLSIKPSENQVETKSETRGPSSSASSKNRPASSRVKEPFSVTEVKKWARDDLTETISWLESQEEKPAAGEMKRIAAEGVLTCLQDAIDSLEQKQDVGSVTELWSFVPRVVKELGKMESSCKTEKATKDQLCKQAKSWKKIYEAELAKKGKEEEASGGRRSRVTSSGYDSDETVEMTEEEIEHAYRNVSLE